MSNGSYLSTESSGGIYQAGLKDNKSSDTVTCTDFLFSPPEDHSHPILPFTLNTENLQVDITLFTLDDKDSSYELESTDGATQLPSESFSMLNVDDIFGSVMETTNQVARVSVSLPFDKPYKEMALHCEALLMGKPQMMSTFLLPLPLQGNPFIISDEDYNQGKEEVPSQSTVQHSLLKTGNPFLEGTMSGATPTIPMLCAAAFQYQTFQLPASSP